MWKYRFLCRPGREKIWLDLPRYHIRLQVQDRAGQGFQQHRAPPNATMRCCSGSRLEGGAGGRKCLGKRQQKYLPTAGQVWNFTKYVPPATPQNVHRKLPSPVLWFTFLMLPYHIQPFPGKPHQNRTTQKKKPKPQTNTSPTSASKSEWN